MSINGKQYVWDFFEDLKKNNSKEWMDENRKRYHTAKQYWLDEVEAMLERLSQHDPSFKQFRPKDVIMRITNNRMFHKDKPIYRTNFSCSPFTKEEKISKIFFSFGPEFTLIGSGLYRPEKEVLKSVREAIDYDAQELIDIISTKKFEKLFGGLAPDEHQLKRVPKGFPADHPQVDLLRRKSFNAHIKPDSKKLIKGNLPDIVENAFVTAQPLVQWLEKATSV
ncbi:DUF2461 domain-containing protein [uncultured Aquimarina sp.]|uniref:DUF2461 domain-containing protein n=1 Tax=uncultured Aquimarina sp. TaxID=575652 RepID=UPI002636646F|nr:DUF2461 domain-containing protein [uncultured Aquimarina sp.]